MEEKSIDPTPLRPEGERITDAARVMIDLAGMMKKIGEETSWKTGDRNAITLFKSDRMRIVLVALHQEAELPEHSANGMISVQVLEGRITFSTGQGSVELPAGQMLTLHERIPHRVKAQEESVFLLTLSPVAG